MTFRALCTSIASDLLSKHSEWLIIMVGFSLYEQSPLSFLKGLFVQLVSFVQYC